MAIIGFCFSQYQTQEKLTEYRHSQGGILLDAIEELGHSIVNFDDPKAEYFLTLDHRTSVFRKIQKRIPKNRRYLFIQEPFVVVPGNYKKRVRSKYSQILSLTPEGAKQYLPWPQFPWLGAHYPAGNQRELSSILINSNKISLIKGSQYGFRRKLVREFGKAKLPLVLCGPNWDRDFQHTVLENLRAIAYSLINFCLPDWSEIAFPLSIKGRVELLGPIPDKQKEMKRCTFAIVIENQTNYVSEKLFDAVFAGCVPLYLGPPLHTFDIPNDVVIELPANVTSFTEIIQDISLNKIEQVVKAGRSWIESDQTRKKWSAEFVYKKAAISIDEWVVSGE